VEVERQGTLGLIKSRGRLVDALAVSLRLCLRERVRPVSVKAIIDIETPSTCAIVADALIACITTIQATDTFVTSAWIRGHQAELGA